MTSVLAAIVHAVAGARQQQKEGLFVFSQRRMGLENCFAGSDTLRISATSLHDQKIWQVSFLSPQRDRQRDRQTGKTADELARALLNCL